MKRAATTMIVIIKPKLFFTKIFSLTNSRPAKMAEGEGFEPPKVFNLSGFQDRRDRPLCHPSGSHPFLH